MALKSTGGNEPIQTGQKHLKNHDQEEIEPLGQNSKPNDDNEAPDVYCMECEDPSVENNSIFSMPLDEERNRESES